jgi:phosphatidylglycerol:prolipoprotein diacylglycerol transferase
VQPAAAYELLANIVLLGLMLFLAYRLRRPGVLMLVYLFGYVTTQFFLFFVRDNLVVSFLGLNWGLKQAQWTSLVVFLCLIPLTFLVLRVSKPIPQGEVAATYGIPQKSNLDGTPMDTHRKLKAAGGGAMEQARTDEAQTITADSLDGSEG